jgi:hypothetical protein
MKNKMIKMVAFATFSLAVSFATLQGVKAETVKTGNIKAIIVAEATEGNGAVEAVSPDAVNATPQAVTTTSPAVTTTSPAVTTTPPAVTTPGGIKEGGDENTTGVEVDDEFSVGGVFYTVTEIKSGKVYVGVSGVVNDRATTVFIPKKIKYKGYEMTVTSIEEDGFSYMERLRKVVIYADIVKIGNDAFKDAVKFDRFVIRTTKLKKAGKNIFKNVSKKMIIEVPKKSLSSYKKLFKNKGVKVKEIRVIKK